MRRIRTRSQHRPPFSGHTRQHESEAADNAAFADKMIEICDMETPEGLSIPAMSTSATVGRSAGGSVGSLQSEGGAGNFRVQNRHEMIRRDKKVTALVAFLHSKNIGYEKASGMGSIWWMNIAAKAKVNMPSRESRAMVLAELRRLAEPVDYDDAAKDDNLDPQWDDRKGTL